MIRASSGNLPLDNLTYQTRINRLRKLDVFEMEIPGLNIPTPLDICMCLEFYAISYFIKRQPGYLDICMCLEFYAISYFIKRQPGYLKMYLAHLNIF